MHLLGGGGGKIPRGSGILVFLPGMGDILNLTEVCLRFSSLLNDYAQKWKVNACKNISH